MVSAKWNSPPPDLCALLRGVLKDAARTVPESERTSSVMACLAEKILTLAAEGATDPINLRRVALERVRRSCSACHGCGGLRLPHRGPELSNGRGVDMRSI